MKKGKIICKLVVISLLKVTIQMFTIMIYSNIEFVFHIYLNVYEYTCIVFSMSIWLANYYNAYLII